MYAATVMEHATPPQITDFLTELRRQDLSANTVESYRSDLLLFGRWLGATTGDEFATTTVTPTDAREYKAYLVTVERRSPATVNRRLAALRKFFDWAVACGLAKENPISTVREIPVTRTAPKALDKRQVDRLIREAEKALRKRDVAILEVLRGTGIRVAELCALRRDDIEVNERSGSLIVRSGKGSRHRVVPLNLDVRRALSAYIEVRPKVATDSLFVGQRRHGLSARTVEHLVANYARLAGLEDVTPHTLRHTFGKQTLDAGADLVTVSRLLGHQRLETTAIYTTPSAQDLEKAVARIEADYLPTSTERGVSDEQ
jgi:site-specific recombinase XerD